MDQICTPLENDRNQMVSSKAKTESKTELFDLEDEENRPLSNYHIIGWNGFQYGLQFINENRTDLVMLSTDLAQNQICTDVPQAENDSNLV